MSKRSNAIWQSEKVILHCQDLCLSYQYWTKQSLIEDLNLTETAPAKISEHLFKAPFALISHGLEADPIINYGNQVVLDLWQISWQDLTLMPSRQTAEPQAQAERAKFLAQIPAQGFIQNYEGIRISSKGKKFAIANATVWNVIDCRSLKLGQNPSQNLGQAAMFTEWKMLD